jgi:membrane fusion protein, epimerase transport system
VSRVRRNQPARIRFAAFNARTTKLVDGRVFYVAADRAVDRSTNVPYYVALVEADTAALQRAGALQLQAGMPAEVYLQGEQRTALEYLLEPLTQSLRRAARER